MENASYIESITNTKDNSNIISSTTNSIEEDSVPKLFSDEQNYQRDEETNENSDNETEQLFDQDTNEEEDFEIPAFLRKQKF